MSIRTLIASGAAIALTALAVALPASVAGATTQAKLRVLTPNRVLDPGTTYVLADPVRVRARRDADCFGPPGGSGSRFTFEKPVALGLLASGAQASKRLRPLLLTDQFGFGLGICGIGGAAAGPGSFWYMKANHAEAAVGASELRVRDGDEVLFYLAADNFPNPNPAELELLAPARATPGDSFTVRVRQHACATDPVSFETTCSTAPAEGASVRTGGQTATTGADGRATVTLSRSARLLATRGADIPSEALRVCVSEKRPKCPAKRGERIVGTSGGERIKGTPGADAIRARGGRDVIDLRSGGPDRVNCGGGRDTVLAGQGGDDRLRLCERIRRR
jgi:hypothetical protein